MLKEYRCTRNAPYLQQCIGHNDLSARQGYYLLAVSESEAWQKMAVRFPEEAFDGFTIQSWSEFDVSVTEIKRLP